MVANAPKRENQDLFGQFCQQVSDRLSAAGITQEAVLATLPEARCRVYEKYYGNLLGN